MSGVGVSFTDFGKGTRNRLTRQVQPRHWLNRGPLAKMDIKMLKHTTEISESRTWEAMGQGI